MSRLKGLSAQLRDVFRGNDAEARMEEEFEFHLDMETRKLVREGLTPSEARRRAPVTFGRLDAQRETMRDERGRAGSTTSAPTSATRSMGCGAAPGSRPPSR